MLPRHTQLSPIILSQVRLFSDKNDHIANSLLKLQIKIGGHLINVELSRLLTLFRIVECRLCVCKIWNLIFFIWPLGKENWSSSIQNLIDNHKYDGTSKEMQTHAFNVKSVNWEIYSASFHGLLFILFLLILINIDFWFFY